MFNLSVHNPVDDYATLINEIKRLEGLLQEDHVDPTVCPLCNGEGVILEGDGLIHRCTNCAPIMLGGDLFVEY